MKVTMLFATMLFSWSAVHAGLAALTLLISIIGGSLFWVFRHIHNRLSNLENSKGQQRKAIFGAEENPLHIGLTKEVSEVKRDIEELKEHMDNSSVERQDLKNRMVELEQKVERILDQMEEE